MCDVEDMDVYDEKEALKQTHWDNQTLLISKTRDLACKAHWWSTLQRLEVDFDLNIFISTENYGSSNGINQKSNGYSIMMYNLFSGACKTLKNPIKTVHCLLEDYAKSFGADVISFIQIFIEYLLSLPSRR